MEISASMRQGPGGRWVASTSGTPVLHASGATRERCIANLRRALTRWRSGAGTSLAGSEPVTLVVQVVPVLAGVAEAADVMGWDKRRVVTYIDRGRFPDPIQSLASGRVWIRDDVERFAVEWRARRARRRAGS